MSLTQSTRLPLLAAFILVILIFMTAATMPVSAQNYSAMNCSQLWHARNAIYAAKGHCFKTAQGQAVFGKNCFPPFGKLTPGEQSRVGTIKQWEVSKSCGAGGAAPVPAPAPASGYAAMNCNQLWHARNAIYAAKGYCFKTARAQKAFGKRCYSPFGKLSSNEQSRVGAIKQWEGRKGCP